MKRFTGLGIMVGLTMVTGAGMAESGPPVTGAGSKPKTDTTKTDTTKKDTTKPDTSKPDTSKTAVEAKADPRVQEELGKIAAAYRDLTGISLTMGTIGQNGQNLTSKIVFKRPGSLAVEVVVGEQKARLVADGKTIYIDSSSDKTKYFHLAQEKPESAFDMTGKVNAGGVGLLPLLLKEAHAEKQILPGKPASAKLVPDVKVGDEDCELIEATLGGQGQSFLYRFYASKKDHLLRKLTLGPTAKPDTPIVVETYTDINLNPTVTDATFKYTPIEGAVATDFPKPPPSYDPKLIVGADPISLTGKDLDDKPVSLADYKGKVVLVDFWATWCGPCVAELPNVIAAYNKYHAKGFDIVGVSLDQKDSKAKVQSFIKDHKMPWRQIYDGGYWEAANAKAYSVQSIPFTLLIGKDGKIAAVGARGEDLAPAIEAALK